MKKAWNAAEKEAFAKRADFSHRNSMKKSEMKLSADKHARPYTCTGPIIM